MSLLTLLIAEYRALEDRANEIQREYEESLTICDKRRAELIERMESDRKDNIPYLTESSPEPYACSMLTESSLRQLLSASETSHRLASELFNYTKAMEGTFREYLSEGGTTEGFRAALEG